MSEVPTPAPDAEWLAARFSENRPHLQAVAQRMLGSSSEAEDAVQETWLRLARADTAEVANLGGWLTTVVSRICLDLLRAKRSRREQLVDEPADNAGRPYRSPDAGPEEHAVLADSVGAALLVVLETLAPAERLAFVLHDLFAVPFDEIAPIIDKSPAAARQLASRARRRVQGARGDHPENADAARRRMVVAAFLAASRDGDFAGLLRLLDPSAVLRVDPVVLAMGGAQPEVGAQAVATTFVGRAKAAKTATIDGAPGAIWMYRGVVQVVFAFTVVDGAITAIDLLGDPDRLAALEIDY